MKLTDIDLSSLAEIGAAISLLVHVEGQLANGETPLPTIEAPTDARGRRMFVVNPSPVMQDQNYAGMTGEQVVAAIRHEIAQPVATVLQQGEQSVAFQSMDECRAALVADAEARRVDPMDAAAIFGAATQQGATAQSATPLPLAPSTAGVAPSPTAPAALPASGALPALQALAPLPVASAAAPTAHAHPASPAGGVEVDADGLPWDERIHAGTKRKNADGRWTAKRGVNDAAFVARVIAELRAQMAAGGVTAPCALVQVAKDSFQTPQPATAPAPHVTAALVDALQALAGVPDVSSRIAAQEREALRFVTGGAPAQSAAPLPMSTPAPSTVPLAALPMTNGPVSSVAPTPPALPGLQPPAVPAFKATPQTFQDFMTAMTVEVMSGRVPATALLEACKPYGGTTALAANPVPIPAIWAALKQQYPGML